MIVFQALVNLEKLKNHSCWTVVFPCCATILDVVFILWNSNDELGQGILYVQVQIIHLAFNEIGSAISDVWLILI